MIRIHALWAYFHSKDMGYDAIGVSRTLFCLVTCT